MPPPDVSVASEGHLRYLISMPASRPRADDPLPVLCFLHGQAEAIPMPIETSAALHGPLAATAWSEARERFLVIEPQRAGRSDNWIDERELVTQIVRRAQIDLHGDPSRTYLTGFSLGGNGVLDFAEAGDDFWAAYWSVDPTRLPRGQSALPMWISAGPLTQRNQGYDEMAAAANRESFHVTDEADDHVAAARTAYGRAEIYEWLLKQQLNRSSLRRRP